MLPMAFAPNSAGVMRNEALDLTIDTSVAKSVWRFALEQAALFWEKVALDARISHEFQAIARGMQQKLQQVAGTVDKMA